MIGTTTALIMGGLAAAGAIGGAAISSHSAGEAVKAQEESTEYGQNLLKQSADEALAFQKEQWAQEQKNLAPWLSAGTASLDRLQALMGPGGTLSQPYGKTFSYEAFDPSKVDVTQDPGYQFRVEQGLKAINASKAAQGGLVSGAALREAADFGSGLASQEYANAYGRSADAWARNYGRALDTFNTNYNVWQGDQGNLFNRLAALAGVGQTATTQLNQGGRDFASQAGTILLNTGQNIGELATQAGNARASGYIASGNAWGDALGGTLNNLSNLYFLTTPASNSLIRRR